MPTNALFLRGITRVTVRSNENDVDLVSYRARTVPTALFLLCATLLWRRESIVYWIAIIASAAKEKPFHSLSTKFLMSVFYECENGWHLKSIEINLYIQPKVIKMLAVFDKILESIRDSIASNAIRVEMRILHSNQKLNKRCKLSISEFLCRLAAGRWKTPRWCFAFILFYTRSSFLFHLENQTALFFFKLARFTTFTCTKDELRSRITWAKRLSHASKIDRQFPISHANWLIYVNGRKKRAETSENGECH